MYPHLGGRLKKSVDQALGPSRPERLCERHDPAVDVSAHSGRQREPLLATARAKVEREERLGLLENGVRLPVLMDLYIHLLYVLASNILSSIPNSPIPIHPLYHPLSTLSTVGLTCHFI
jgi:hypothetical protein